MSANQPEVVPYKHKPLSMVNSSLPPKWVRWTIFLLLAVLGLSLRLPHLGVRPMHTDEAVNAYIVGDLLAGKSFIYDPQDRHGPLLSAVALPLVKMQGAKTFSDLTESELRLTTVLAGTITILLFGAAVELFGFFPCMIAALLFAISPLPVYYDRYFIHESIFVASTFGLIIATWRAGKTLSTGQTALAATCAALMLASKETALLHFFALAAAAVIFWYLNPRRKNLLNLWQPRMALIATTVFILLSVMLFTWFGSNWKVFAALMQALPNFMARAGGAGHQKTFWYYAKLLSGGWSGGVILALTCIGFIFATLKRRRSAFHFLALYAVFISILYCTIPYKTPWLALNLWLPISLFVGLAFESLWQMPAQSPALRNSLRVVCILVAVAVIPLLAHDTQQRVFLHPADENNPYAYVHTSEDILGLPVEIDRLAQQNSIASPRIAVIAADPWPLPWYLRHYPQVGFWQPGQQPGMADFYITSTDAADAYANQLQGYRPEFFGERPDVLILLWSPTPK